APAVRSGADVLTSLIELAALLRRAGLRVSTGEVIDGARALDAAGLARDDVIAALRATLVKRSGDLAAFDELLALHVAGAASDVGSTPPGALLAASGPHRPRAVAP